MIVAGFGCRADATEASFANALAAARGDISVDAVATVQDKSPILADFAKMRDLPLIAVSQSDMEAQTTTTLSDTSLAAKNTGSVAEACALAAAGRNARLLATRQVSQDRMVTCAIAQGDG